MASIQEFEGPLSLLDSEFERSVWIGAASFEERSIGSLEELKAASGQLESVRVILYSTSVHPASVGEELRAANLRKLKSLATSLHVPNVETVVLPAYAFGACQRWLQEVLDQTKARVIIDISCLTKVHTLAAASVIASMPEKEILISYTIPENYPSFADTRSHIDGWKDIIVAPFGDSPRFFNETSGRGVVILGHEADRLVVALAEIEPAGGSILLGASQLRPDLGEVSRRRNQKMLHQLTTMRTADWQRIAVDIRDFEGIRAAVLKEVARAAHYGAPVILFPYGPKPIIFSTAYELAAAYRENAWFVYPVPSSYDANYSEGIGEVCWFKRPSGQRTIVGRPKKV